MSLDDRVGSDEYLTSFANTVDEQGFPDPDPELVPQLTEARYVADAARDTGDDDYADELEGLRSQVIAPLEAFDRTMAELEQQLGAEVDEDAFYDEVQQCLSDREQSFLDYPAPPHHMLEAADTGGMNTGSDYEQDRERIEDIVTAARDLARDAYHADDHVPAFGEYDSADAYADVVAFNTALAAETMLEQQGDIVTPP